MNSIEKKLPLRIKFSGEIIILNPTKFTSELESSIAIYKILNGLGQWTSLKLREACRDTLTSFENIQVEFIETKQEDLK